MRALNPILWIAVAATALAASARGQGCDIPAYGTTCRTALAGTYRLDTSSRVVDLQVSTSTTAKVGLVFAGNQAVAIKLPGDCTLLAVPQVVIPISFDASGRTTISWKTPPSSVIADLSVQAAALEITSSNFFARTSNGLKLGPWLGVQTLLEDFKTTANRDNARTDLAWTGDGSLRISPFAAVDELGDFDVRFGGKDSGKKDAKGRPIYEWNTDLIVIPASRTPSKKEVRVTDGILRFRSFKLGSLEHIRFVGTHPVRIETVDSIVIDGVVDVSGVNATKLEGSGGRPGRIGQPGFAGGPGAGSGGRGGDSPHKSGVVNVSGFPGEVPKMPGHPLQARLALRAGLGSLSYPRPTVDKSVTFSAYTGVISQQATSGGSGAVFTNSGLAGRTVDNGRGTETPKPIDFGPATDFNRTGILTLGTIVRALPTTMPSADFFLIPGAGGGGAGTHPSTCYDASGFEPLNWSPGSGGGGGGGAILLRSAGTLTLGIAGQILARGGSGVTYDCDQRNFTNPAPGGGGSGGSVVIQSLSDPDLRGTIDVRGGAAGHFRSSNYGLRVDSLSGAGGDGLYRVEADNVPKLSFLTAYPPVTADNAAALRTVDKPATKGTAISKWIDLQRLPGAWHHYVLTATIGSKSAKYSDVALFGLAVPSSLTVEFQSATLDRNGQPIGAPGAWHSRLSAIQGDARRGNGVRFRITIDEVKAQSPVRVEALRIVYDC